MRRLELLARCFRCIGFDQKTKTTTGVNRMTAIVLPAVGSSLPSLSGSVMYTVIDSSPGEQVTLSSPSRQEPAVLPWSEIECVLTFARTAPHIDTGMVDDALENEQYRKSSPMCAVVLAILDPNRVREP